MQHEENGNGTAQAKTDTQKITQNILTFLNDASGTVPLGAALLAQVLNGTNVSLGATIGTTAASVVAGGTYMLLGSKAGSLKYQRTCDKVLKNANELSDKKFFIDNNRQVKSWKVGEKVLRTSSTGLIFICTVAVLALGVFTALAPSTLKFFLPVAQFILGFMMLATTAAFKVTTKITIKAKDNALKNFTKEHYQKHEHALELVEKLYPLIKKDDMKQLAKFKESMKIWIDKGLTAENIEQDHDAIEHSIEKGMTAFVKEDIMKPEEVLKLKNFQLDAMKASTNLHVLLREKIINPSQLQSYTKEICSFVNSDGINKQNAQRVMNTVLELSKYENYFGMLVKKGLNASHIDKHDKKIKLLFECNVTEFMMNGLFTVEQALQLENYQIDAMKEGANINWLLKKQKVNRDIFIEKFKEEMCIAINKEDVFTNMKNGSEKQVDIEKKLSELLEKSLPKFKETAIAEEKNELTLKYNK